MTSKKQCLPPTMELVQDGASSESGSGYGFPFLTKNYNQYPLTKEKLAISNWMPLNALTTLKVGTKPSSGWATWKEQNFCRLCLILLCLATFVLIFFWSIFTSDIVFLWFVVVVCAVSSLLLIFFENFFLKNKNKILFLLRERERKGMEVELVKWRGQ